MSNFKKNERAMKNVKSKGTDIIFQTVQDVALLETCRGIPARKISEETCELFEIKEEVDGKGVGIAHYFPVRFEGSITGYIKRRLDVPKDSEKAWTIVGEATPGCEFLGQEQANRDGTRTLLIVEGFYDVLAAHQMVMKHTDPKWKDYINIVSLTHGATNALKNCLANESFIAKHKKLLLGFDNDFMTEEDKKKTPRGMKGDEATQAVGLRFKDAMKVPLELNDPCEYLKAGKSKDFYNLVAFNQTEIQFAHLTRGIGMTSEQICEAYPEGVESNILPILNKKLRGYRPYELTLLMGPPKAGKSSVAREIAYDFLISTDEIVCYCSLEDNKRQIADVFVALDNNVPVDKYMFDKTLISKEDVDKTLTTILAPDRFILIDTEEGTIRAREIIGLLEKAVDMGATKFIFDHFSYLTDVSSGAGSSTKQEIDMLLTEVKNLTKNYPIHMIGINHVTIDKSRGIVRDQETGQTTYPYWYRTSRYDGAGSSGFTKITDNLILLDIKFIADEVVGQRQCKLALNRRAIATGACDYFTLDSKTGRLKVTSG